MKHNPKKIDKQILMLRITANLKTTSLALLFAAIAYSVYATAKSVDLNPLAYFVNFV